MARAKRHYIPGQIWHITHRCHKREFLLKFAKDRRRWLQWLFEAKKRYDLPILNYAVTSNHIHLMVSDNGQKDTIPKSIQLIAGRTGQEYNKRKSRKRAFWEDRYHATAVSFDEHFFKCMVYTEAKKGLELRRKVERLLEAKKATNFVNQLFVTGSILPLKMAF